MERMDRMLTFLTVLFFTWSGGAFKGMAQDRPAPGALECPVGVIVSVKGSLVEMDLSDGSRRTVDLSSGIPLVRTVRGDVKALQPGQAVIIQGPDHGDGILDAFLIVLLSDPRQISPRGRDDVRGWCVIDTDPIRVRNNRGTFVVRLSEQTEILEERPISSQELRIGETIRLVGPMDQPEKMVLPDRPLVPRDAPRSTDAPKDLSDSVPIRGRLPLPPIPAVNAFDRTCMDQTLTSPFGFKDATMYRTDPLSWYEDYAQVMKDLGVHWMEPAGPFGLYWNAAQGRDSSGAYTPFRWERYDRLVQNAQFQNVHLSCILHATDPSPVPGGRVIPSRPKDMEGFRRFVSAAVERYDRDGREDMPGLLYPIRHWKIEDEAFSPRFFNGSARDYVDVLIASYEAVKDADSDAVVILSMLKGHENPQDSQEFMTEFFEEFSQRSSVPQWDIMDHHNIGPQPLQYRELKDALKEVKDCAAKYGIATTPFWTLETAGVYTPDLDHASDLIKRFVYPFSLGVQKVFWSGIIQSPVTLPGEDKDLFHKVTLIDASGRKRPAYFALQRLVSALEGVDLSRTKTLRDDEGVCIFEFMKQPKSIWIFWQDGEGVVRQTIKVPRSTKKLTLTSLVSSTESESPVDQGHRCSDAKVLVPQNGRVTIEIGELPLLLSQE